MHFVRVYWYTQIFFLGITVPPPTLVDESAQQEEDLYEADPRAPPARSNYPAPRPRPQAQPVREFQDYSPPQQFEPAPAATPPRAKIAGNIR